MAHRMTRREMLGVSAASMVGPAVADSCELDVRQDSPIKTRVFWTWDHSTEWALNRPGAQTMGASNYYARSTETFIQDYSALLAWCGRHHVNAVVVWGLLRESHGGLDSAKKLCEVAQKHGVRLLAGVGLNAYGGVYYEGDSRYSLERHLTKHPELYGLDPGGNKMIRNFGVYGPKLTHHACPSRTENQEFAAESLRWLFKNLPLGGVQIETGDTGVCRCARCQERRKHPVSGLSWEDMALMYPLAAEAIRSVAPEAWILCETYSHPQLAADPSKAADFGGGKPAWADECLSRFPEGTFVQWVGDKLAASQPSALGTEAGKALSARHRHIIRAHYSTYWGGVRGEPALGGIAALARQSVLHGFDAISIFGEVSPFHTGAELNYLAFEDFASSSNPGSNMDVFIKEKAAPLLGGEVEAREFLELAGYRSKGAEIPKALRRIYDRMGKLPAQAARRWSWLAAYLSSFAYPDEG
jgi:hypothetical protein